MKIIFIGKTGGDSQQYSYMRKFSGLYNSAKFIVEMLKDEGVEAKLIDVVDNNGIDRVVYQEKPDIVVIEALWVVPQKFEVLTKLHPKVLWVVRIHSDIPFLATEGVAIDWVLQYFDYPNVMVAPNHRHCYETLRDLYKSHHNHREHRDCEVAVPLVYLPNYYPNESFRPREPWVRRDDRESIDVGCFGAIRPMKNQLNQALAAIKFADVVDRDLRFHINTSRVEGEKKTASNVLRNIRALFEESPRHKLVEHGWLKHDDFLQLLYAMDLGMQVSFSETFNIVAADMVHVGCPVVASKEIEWLPGYTYANPNDIGSIYNKLCLLWRYRRMPGLSFLNRLSLSQYSRNSRRTWMEFLNYIG